ncbi:hypothetical protein, partial [Cupriavidus oxalaticus]|uniref:hypothetical protein n=1 Tax=Cupriavidus oxalaticus TaxID=96344 RepID=UPI003180F357
TLDLAILWRLHRVQPGRLNTMKSASGGHFCFAKTGHYRFAATNVLRIRIVMSNIGDGGAENPQRRKQSCACVDMKMPLGCSYGKRPVVPS